MELVSKGENFSQLTADAASGPPMTLSKSFAERTAPKI
jgi:hypothetical protein